jgi:hypothetical protein
MPSSGLARAAVWLEPEGGLALAFAWPDSELAAECIDAPRRALIESACYVPIDSLDNGGEIFSFDVDGRLTEVRGLDPGGVTRFLATFEDYRRLEDEAEEITFPNRVTVRSPAAESRARFVWKRVMLADDVPDRFFMIPERGESSEEG